MKRCLDCKHHVRELYDMIGSHPHLCKAYGETRFHPVEGNNEWYKLIEKGKLNADGKCPRYERKWWKWRAEK